MSRPSRLFLLFTAACGAVAVPEERSYRLPMPAAAPPGAPRDPRVLRVEPLRLGAHLSADHLMVADGPVLLRTYPLERWAGPLDGMVTDLVLGCLRRAAVFADVRSIAEPGAEDLALAATVLDFHHDRGAGRAVVRLAVRLREARDLRLLIDEEFSVSEPVEAGEPAAAVAALGRAVATLVHDIARRCSAAAAPSR